MLLIKRYPNRKLYDTDSKQYITLDGIASLIRSGEEVQVVDNVTGEDLTAVTLTQIIFEQEKKQSGFLPRSVLAGLIKTGGERLTAIQKTLVSSMGLGHHVDEEIRRRIDSLIDQDELTREEGQTLLKKLLSDTFHQEQEAQDQATWLTITPEALEKHLRGLQIPTQQDLEKLLAQIDTLSEKINDLTET